MADTSSTWKKLAAEWFTIFISITAAFALDRWNDARKENELEIKSVHALIQEVQADTLSLSDALRRNKKNMEALLRFDLLIQQNRVPADSSVLYAIRMLNISNFASSKTTYDMLKSSGGLSVIRDFEVRQALIATYGQFEYRSLIENMEQNFMQTFAVPILFRSVDFSMLRTENQEFCKTTEFRNTLIGSIRQMQQKIAYYDNCLTSARELHQRLIHYEKTIQ